MKKTMTLGLFAILLALTGCDGGGTGPTANGEVTVLLEAEDTITEDEVEAFHTEFAAARVWWGKQFPPKEPDGGR